MVLEIIPLRYVVRVFRLSTYCGCCYYELSDWLYACYFIVYNNYGIDWTHHPLYIYCHSFALLFMHPFIHSLYKWIHKMYAYIYYIHTCVFLFWLVCICVIEGSVCCNHINDYNFAKNLYNSFCGNIYNYFLKICYFFRCGSETLLNVLRFFMVILALCFAYSMMKIL